MKCISFNVNGLRAIVGKNFEEDFKQLDADFFCLQETKMQAGQLDLQFDGYYSYFNYAERKGYSGTAIYTKHEPLNVTYGIGIDEHDTEGRVITLEYDKFFFITVYTPNSGSELKRLEYRMSWEEDFKNYLLELKQNKRCRCLWRFKCCSYRNRFKKSEIKYEKCRIHTRRKRKIHEVIRCWIYRYV